MKKLILIISLLLISGLAKSEEPNMKMVIYSTLSIEVEYEFHKICYYQHPLHGMKDFFLKNNKFFGKKINSKDSCPYFMTMNDEAIDNPEQIKSINNYIEDNSISF